MLCQRNIRMSSKTLFILGQGYANCKFFSNPDFSYTVYPRSNMIYFNGADELLLYTISIEYCELGMCPSMVSQCISCSENLFTEVAWNGYSFQMIRFNVIFHVRMLSLLSTNFAQISKSTCTSVTILAFLHQRFHLFIKLSKIHR